MSFFKQRTRKPQLPASIPLLQFPKSVGLRNADAGGRPWREVSGISYNGYIISMLSYTNSCLLKQAWARGITKKDISMLFSTSSFLYG